MKMHGEVVVITGAANGIGKSLALRMAEAGAAVWALDRDDSGLRKLRDETEKQGYRVLSRTVDVAEPAHMRATTSEILATDGKISHWVNNAGVSGLGDFMEQSHENFERVIRVNLSAVVLGTRLALEAMEKKGKGTIINMASVAGHIPAPFLSAYCATKFGVVGFTRSLREEMRMKASPIKFVLVSPGFVETTMIAKGSTLGFPEKLSWLLASADDVAAEILRGLKRNQTEIVPTLNGRLMLKLQKFVPGASSKGSKLLLSLSSRG